MRSIIKTRIEIEKTGRDAPGFYLYGLQEDKDIITEWKELHELADVIRKSFSASRYPDHEFYLIELNDIDAELGEVENIQRVYGNKVKGGKTVFRGGDIIFARIEPSIYNKKTAKVPDLGECLGSTEFLVARPKEGVNPDYLLWALRSKWVAQQVLGKMTGSTGRRRFEDSDFAKLLIPFLSPEMQEDVAKVLQSARNKYRRLLTEASQALVDGEDLAVELLQSNGTTESPFSNFEFETSITPDKWIDIEKLYLPKKDDTNPQLEFQT